MISIGWTASKKLHWLFSASIVFFYWMKTQKQNKNTLIQKTQFKQIKIDCLRLIKILYKRIFTSNAHLSKWCEWRRPIIIIFYRKCTGILKLKIYSTTIIVINPNVFNRKSTIFCMTSILFFDFIYSGALQTHRVKYLKRVPRLPLNILEMNILPPNIIIFAYLNLSECTQITTLFMRTWHLF